LDRERAGEKEEEGSDGRKISSKRAEDGSERTSEFLMKLPPGKGRGGEKVTVHQGRILKGE